MEFRHQLIFGDGARVGLVVGGVVVVPVRGGEDACATELDEVGVGGRVGFAVESYEG